VGGQRHAPAALPPGKTRYPLYRRLGGPQGRSGRETKISPLPGFDPPERPARSEALYRLSYPGAIMYASALYLSAPPEYVTPFRQWNFEAIRQIFEKFVLPQFQ